MASTLNVSNRKCLFTEKYATIERENLILLTKMHKIIQTPGASFSTRRAEVGPKSMNIRNRRAELERIAKENARMLQKLNNIKPSKDTSHAVLMESARNQEEALYRISAYASGRKGEENRQTFSPFLSTPHGPSTLPPGSRPASAFSRSSSRRPQSSSRIGSSSRPHSAFTSKTQGSTRSSIIGPPSSSYDRHYGAGNSKNAIHALRMNSAGPRPSHYGMYGGGPMHPDGHYPPQEYGPRMYHPHRPHPGYAPYPQDPHGPMRYMDPNMPHDGQHYHMDLEMQGIQGHYPPPQHHPMHPPPHMYHPQAHPTPSYAYPAHHQQHQPYHPGHPAHAQNTNPYQQYSGVPRSTAPAHDVTGSATGIDYKSHLDSAPGHSAHALSQETLYYGVTSHPGTTDPSSAEGMPEEASTMGPHSARQHSVPPTSHASAHFPLTNDVDENRSHSSPKSHSSFVVPAISTADAPDGIQAGTPSTPCSGRSPAQVSVGTAETQRSVSPRYTAAAYHLDGSAIPPLQPYDQVLGEPGGSDMLGSEDGIMEGEDQTKDTNSVVDHAVERVLFTDDKLETTSLHDDFSVQVSVESYPVSAAVSAPAFELIEQNSMEVPEEAKTSVADHTEEPVKSSEEGDDVEISAPMITSVVPGSVSKPLSFDSLIASGSKVETVEIQDATEPSSLDVTEEAIPTSKLAVTDEEVDKVALEANVEAVPEAEGATADTEEGVKIAVEAQTIVSDSVDKPVKSLTTGQGPEVMDAPTVVKTVKVPDVESSVENAATEVVDAVIAATTLGDNAKDFESNERPVATDAVQASIVLKDEKTDEKSTDALVKVTAEVEVPAVPEASVSGKEPLTTIEANDKPLTGEDGATAEKGSAELVLTSPVASRAAVDTLDSRASRDEMTGINGLVPEIRMPLPQTDGFLAASRLPQDSFSLDFAIDEGAEESPNLEIEEFKESVSIFKEKAKSRRSSTILQNSLDTLSVRSETANVAPSKVDNVVANADAPVREAALVTTEPVENVESTVTEPSSPNMTIESSKKEESPKEEDSSPTPVVDVVPELSIGSAVENTLESVMSDAQATASLSPTLGSDSSSQVFNTKPLLPLSRSHRPQSARSRPGTSGRGYPGSSSLGDTAGEMSPLGGGGSALSQSQPSSDAAVWDNVSSAMATIMEEGGAAQTPNNDATGPLPIMAPRTLSNRMLRPASARPGSRPSSASVNMYSSTVPGTGLGSMDSTSLRKLDVVSERLDPVDEKNGQLNEPPSPAKQKKPAMGVSLDDSELDIVNSAAHVTESFEAESQQPVSRVVLDDDNAFDDSFIKDDPGGDSDDSLGGEFDAPI